MGQYSNTSYVWTVYPSGSGTVGSGDMEKATYDTNNNGTVDNSEHTNGHTVNSDVPENAVFTDTTYSVGDGGLTQVNFTSDLKDGILEKKVSDVQFNNATQSFTVTYTDDSSYEFDASAVYNDARVSNATFSDASKEITIEFNNPSIASIVVDLSPLALLETLNVALSGKVNNSRVLTDVPSGATFTDTTYSVENGELSQNNLTDILKAAYDNAVSDAHSHANESILNATTASYTSEEKIKLAGIDDSGGYVHPTEDGDLHVPETGTINEGKVLTAGATAGSLSWEVPDSGGASALGSLTDVDMSGLMNDQILKYNIVSLKWENSTIDLSGSGDMSKSTYDTNDNGIVDNAALVNNLTVLTAVPSGAVFTDTTYSIGNGGLTQINFTNALNTKLIGISDNANNYSLPTATATILGGVKQGTNIIIDANGVISAASAGANLHDLGDTNIVAPVNGQSLMYNGTNWYNGVGAGSGDMSKSTYDTDDSGVVDNSELVNGFSVNTAVPSGAVFTDTTYTVGNGGLTQINFTSTLNTKLSGISDNANNYSLPIATDTVLGGVKQGTNITIDAAGVISSTGGTIVIDNLDSTSATDALSANQGYLLDDRVTHVTDIFNGQVVSGFDRRLPERMGDISFDDATRILTIEPVSGQTEFDVFVCCDKYTKTSAETVSIADSSGLHFFYYDLSGVLQSTSTYADELITEYAIVSVVYWNSTTSSSVIFGDERHGIAMSGQAHLAFHKMAGAYYRDGMAITGLSTTTSTFTLLTAGSFADEDILLDVAQQTSAPFLYYLGTEWTLGTDTSAISWMGATYPYYNSIIAGSGSLVEIANNSFTLTFILATNNISNSYVKVLGQKEYGTLVLAEEGVMDEIASLYLTGLPTPEFVFVGAIVVDEDGNSVQTVDGSDYIDLRHTTKRYIVTSGGDGGEITTIAELSDTNIVTPAAGQSLVYNGSYWANSTPSGTGDMLKSVYDTNDDGVVDNAALVNSLSVETAVPSGALFTDTVTSVLSDLTDVTLGTPVADDILLYSGTAWVESNSSVFAFRAEENTYTATQISAVTIANTGACSLVSGNKFSTTPTAGITLSFTDITGKDGMGGSVFLDNTGGHAISKDASIKCPTDMLTAVSTVGIYILGFEVFGGVVHLTSTGALS